MKFFKLVSLAYLLLISLSAHADDIAGTVKISGGFFPISAPITGDINLSSSSIAINPTAIFGAPFVTVESELLFPGAYTRTYNLSSGGSISRTATIPADTVGAYFVINYNNSSYHQLFMAWDVSTDGLAYDNRPISGDVWIGGAYNGRRVYFNFEIVPPLSDVTVQAIGAGTYECGEISGSTITLDSIATTAGIAVLDRVEWVVDGVLVAQGTSITHFFSLGNHIVEATAIATDGGSATDTINVSVNDTIDPTLQIVFLDGAGNPVTSALNGDYTVQYISSDICDSVLNVIGSAKPVMSVLEGDVISIDQISGDVVMPTTAVEISATVNDSSGNTSRDTKILLIE